MAFRSSSSLFSLQPSQGRGLSAFGAYGADLPKIGSMQEFIDPTLDGGEGLSLDASEQPLDLSTLQQGEGGELVSSVTGARIPGQSVLGAATTSTTGTRASGPQGPELSQDREEVDWTKLAQGAPGAVTKGISALQSLRSLFGGTPDITGAPGETKFDFDVPEIDWENPEAVSQWLASNPEAQHSLFGQEVGQSPQDISSWLQQTGGFDLGDTRLASGFLDQFEAGAQAPSPSTGTIAPGVPKAVGDIGSAVGGALGLAGTATGLEGLGLAGKAATAIGKFAQNPTNPANIGSALSLVAALTEDKGLGELANIVGGITQIAQLVGPIASAAISGSTAAMQAATAAAAAAAPAAVVAAVIQMAMAIANGIQAGNPPGQIVLDTLAAPDFIASTIMSKFIDPMFHPSEDWMTFPSRVGETAKLSGSSLQALAKALPYVSTKQELADLISAYESTVGTRVGGFGEGNDPYAVAAPPGVGERTHGFKTTAANFEPLTGNIQEVVNQLRQILPDTSTMAGLGGRAFAQALDPSYAAPQVAYPAEMSAMYEQLYGTPYPIIGGQMMVPAAPGMSEGYVSRPGQAGYQYDLPGAYARLDQPVGAPSASWLQLSGGVAPAAPTGPAPVPYAAPGLSYYTPSPDEVWRQQSWSNTA